MTTCRVCASPIGEVAYEASAPALTSMMAFIDIPTLVFVCDDCGHAQCADLPDIETFYDTTYRISLESDDHDQIFAVAADGSPIYRTDHQAAIGLRLMDLPQGAAILDYGAGKATTLRKMCAARPDLKPHVFDVSRDYMPAWTGWVTPENQSTYSVPEAWSGRFQAIISHFVIEHVADVGTELRLSVRFQSGSRLDFAQNISTIASPIPAVGAAARLVVPPSALKVFPVSQSSS